MIKRICVIGMGGYGSTMARELYQSGHDVLVIDADEAKIQEQTGHVTYAVRADATNESVLRELNVQDYDVGIVALGGEYAQASIGATVVLKGLKIPMVIARAISDQHGEILENIGADRVIYPEVENARRVAKLHFVPELQDYMPILADYGISKIRPPEGMLNKTLEEVGLSGAGDRHGLSVLAIRRGRTSFLHPSKDEVIQHGDVLFLAATSEQLSKLPEMAKRLEGAASAGQPPRGRT